METNNSQKALEYIYPHTQGLEASFSYLEKEQQDEVASIIVSAAANGMAPVREAMKAGIPELTAATCLSALVNPLMELHTLEKNTLKVLLLEEAPEPPNR